MNRMFAATTALAAAVALAILTGCSPAATRDATAPSRLPDTSSVQTPAEASGPTPTPTPSETSIFGESVKNSHGNLVKKLGQLAGTGSVDDASVITSTFAVTDIVVDKKCTSGFSDQPVNGHYLALHLNVETTAALADDEYPSMVFDPVMWQAYDADGKRVNDPAGSAFTCLTEKDTLPSEIGPGQSVSGWIVLDVPTTHGTVVLSLSGTTGWEWSY